MSEKQENGTQTPQNQNSKRAELVSKVDDRFIIEEVYQPQNNTRLFAIFDGEKVDYKEEIEISGRIYAPLKTTLIEKNVVLLPAIAENYSSTLELIKEIKEHIHKYYECPEIFEDLDAYFALFTWVHDKFSVTPYRRVLGDYGTGKSRFLRVLGSICYRPIFINSASSVASIYRIIDLLHGTVIIDEADFYFSDYHSDLVKILNCGYQKGTPILRCATEQDKYTPQAYDVYGPKILASRDRFEDDALESRFVTHETDICFRKDVPTELSSEFHRETLKLRNKLLLWRFHHYRQKTEPDPELEKLNIEPRLKEILLPLSSIIADPVSRNRLREIARRCQESIIRKRRLGLEVLILETIIRMRKNKMPLQVGHIAQIISNQLEDEELSARKCGEIVRRNLRLETKRGLGSNSICKVVIWERQKILKLCSKFGLEYNNLTSLTSEQHTNPQDTETSIDGFISFNQEERAFKENKNQDEDIDAGSNN